MARVVKLIVLFVLVPVLSFSQETPPLERTVSLELHGETSREALKRIEGAAEVVFSYRTDLVSENDHLNRTYIDKSVREVLDDIFQGKLIYREKGNYIILKTAPEPKETEFTVEGYVFNAATGEKLAYASVYDSLSLTAAVTDEYGHYSMVIQKRSEIPLVATKYGFIDTLIVIRPEGKVKRNFYLRPVADTSFVASDSTWFDKRIENWKGLKLTEEQKATIRNFKENFKRDAQFSLLPVIGTNGVMSPSTTVDYSFNLIGGLNGGVNIFEIGGIFNAVWDTVRYVQIAGAFNLVGGPQYGAQVAGIANVNGSSFEGAQVSGLLNFTQGPFDGAQVAGFGNGVIGSMDGVQAAGFANYAGDSSDVVQVSPVVNYLGAGSRGSQISAVANVCEKDFIGLQVSAVCNYAENGFIGSQVSGLVNVAGKMTGSQVGLFNFSDSINGVPFGFLSFSRKGLHQLEVSANELTHLNIAFKSGTNQFYNSFIGGIRYDSPGVKTWALGYGVGSSVRAGGRNRLFFDLQAVNHFTNGPVGFALNNKLTISYQFHIANKFALALGPSANLYMVNLGDLHDSNALTSIVPYSFYDHVTNNGMSLQGWVGGHVALRLF